jgi:hypothetical protein
MPDERVVARLKQLAQRESELRTEFLSGPVYFAQDLSTLEAHHRTVAHEIESLLEDTYWPGRSMLGDDMARELTRLVSSCWSEPGFMRRCLPLMDRSRYSGEIWGEWFAVAYDTIMFFENKPQVFGTFVDWDEKLELSPWLIVKPDLVDDRRDLIGCGPLKNHVEYSRWIAREKGLAPPNNHESYRADLHRWALKRGWARLG